MYKDIIFQFVTKGDAQPGRGQPESADAQGGGEEQDGDGQVQVELGGAAGGRAFDERELGPVPLHVLRERGQAGGVRAAGRRRLESQRRRRLPDGERHGRGGH